METCGRFINSYDEMKAAGFINPEIDNLISSSNYGLQRIRSPKARYKIVKPVALVGAAGQGKSSLANSLVDEKHVTVETDDSDRGTTIIQELCAALPQQTDKYNVKVRYLKDRR